PENRRNESGRIPDSGRKAVKQMSKFWGSVQARDPLWNPRTCARIACPLRGCPPSSFRLADGFTRVPPRDA
ncbi:hypothetical protein ACX1HF_21630, partial [Yersinia pseudotuberculosis]